MLPRIFLQHNPLAFLLLLLRFSLLKTEHHDCCYDEATLHVVCCPPAPGTPKSCPGLWCRLVISCLKKLTILQLINQPHLRVIIETR